MALFYHRMTKQVSCNQCYTYYEAPNGAHEFVYKGQIFKTDESDCPHCDRHGVPEIETTNLINDTPKIKLKDWGAF